MTSTRNSSLALSIPANRPVARRHVAVLKALSSVLSNLKIDFVVAGATARDLVLWNVFGVREERATHDVDVAMCTLSWHQYDSAVAALLRSEGFKQGSAAHTLLFSDASTAHPIPVDIVPFGQVADADGNIHWPPDGKTVMCVQGFQEALRASLKVCIAPDIAVCVTSPAALINLKTIAWSERGFAKNTDAPDILHIAKHYDVVLGDEIWNDETMLVMEQYEHDPTLVAARILGQQAYTLANPDTRAKVAAALKEHDAFERFVLAATRSGNFPVSLDSLESNKKILEVLRIGLLGG